MRNTRLVSSAVASLLIAAAAGPALAQDQQQPAQQGQAQQQPNQQDQVAQQCLGDLRDLALQMEEEGFWLTGWGWRWGPGPVMAPRTPAGAPATTGATGTATDTARPGETGVEGAVPWAATGPQPLGVNSPRFQIRTLYSAANVLAYRGDEQGCQAILEELRSAYDQYAMQLREAGVEPGEITTWRQQRIAAAEPVEQVRPLRVLTIDDITGTDVRNLQDEDLGSVDDVVLDPQTGNIAYVIVARDGFLGVGEDHVAVPWEQFMATPGVNLLVLDISESALEQAPEIDPERFSDPEVFAEIQERTDAFWEERQQG